MYNQTNMQKLPNPNKLIIANKIVLVGLPVLCLWCSWDFQ